MEAAEAAEEWEEAEAAEGEMVAIAAADVYVVAKGLSVKLQFIRLYISFGSGEAFSDMEL